MMSLESLENKHLSFRVSWPEHVNPKPSHKVPWREPYNHPYSTLNPESPKVPPEEGALYGFPGFVRILYP